MPPAPPVPVMNLEVDPKEDPEEEEEDPMDDEDRLGVEDERVTALELEPMAEEPPVPRGARLVVISTQPQIIRTAMVARGWQRGAGTSSS